VISSKPELTLRESKFETQWRDLRPKYLSVELSICAGRFDVLSDHIGHRFSTAFFQDYSQARLP
jgi:hypothetical protein